MMPLGNVSGVVANVALNPVPVIVQAQMQSEIAQQVDPVLVQEGVAIDSYFNKRDMPLEGTGLKMAEAAQENGLDWRLIPAIAVRESTGGKNACDKVQNNPFGWNSCKVGFDSVDKAIDTLAANLGGKNPSTAKHYDGKTTTEILHTYNPPSIVPHYAEEVISIMNTIGNPDLAKTPTTDTVAIANT